MAFWKIEDFFLDSDHSDTRIRVQCIQDEKEFEVSGHSSVLRRASKVFQAMLQSNKFKEGNTKVLDIKVQGDINDGVSFIRYLYTRKLENLDILSYVSILQTAHLYDLSDLAELCEKHIRLQVTPYSICKIFVALEKLATEDLKTFFVHIMLKSAFFIFANNHHISLSEETVKVLMESDQLNIVDERQVIDALWSWALANASIENKSNTHYIKSKTSNLLILVRWSFVKCVNENAPWCYLFDANTNVIGKTRCSDEKVSFRKFSYAIHFNDARIYSRNMDVSSLFTSIQFTVNRSVFLTGLTISTETNVKEVNYEKSKFRIFVNNLSVIIRIKEVTSGRQDGANTLFSRLIIMELNTPVLLTATGINVIAIRPPRILHNQMYITFSVPVYKTSKNPFNIASETDPDTVFTVCGEVIAFVKLYYLPK